MSDDSSKEKNGLALWLAAADCDASKVEELLSMGANVNASLGKGFTPLLRAALKGHLEVCKLLLACDQCNQRATQRGSLKIHIDSKHKGIKYNCNQCDDKATVKYTLKMHIGVESI